MKTRIKTHQLPGDVSKKTKQTMLEKGYRPDTAKYFGYKQSEKEAKTFKKDLLKRERATIKERTKVLIDNQLDSDQCCERDYDHDGNCDRHPNKKIN